MTRSFALMTAAALAVAPVAAQAAPPRIDAPVAASEELGGESLVIPIVLAVAVVIAIYLAIDSEDHLPPPVSP